MYGCVPFPNRLYVCAFGCQHHGDDGRLSCDVSIVHHDCENLKIHPNRSRDDDAESSHDSILPEMIVITIWHKFFVSRIQKYELKTVC